MLKALRRELGHGRRVWWVEDRVLLRERLGVMRQNRILAVLMRGGSDGNLVYNTTRECEIGIKFRNKEDPRRF
jgi:hypothetical protein